MRAFKAFSVSIIWLWLGIFALIPIALVFVTSILTNDPNALVKLPITLSSYLHLFNLAYLKILIQSLMLAFSCTLLCLLLAYPFAFIIARSKSRYKNLFLLLIIIPFWTSSLIRTYAIMITLKAHGLLNSLLMTLGVIHHPLQILYSYSAVLIGTTYDLLPFMILPLYANLEKLDDTLLEAARDLGASKTTTFFKIIIPLSLPGMIAGSILVFLPAMTMFYIPVLLGGAKNMLLGNLIENQFLVASNWPGGAAISIFIILVMVMVLYKSKLRSKSFDL